MPGVSGLSQIINLIKYISFIFGANQKRPRYPRLNLNFRLGCYKNLISNFDPSLSVISYIWS